MVAGSAEQRQYLEEHGGKRRVIIAEKPVCSTLPEGFHPFHLKGDPAEAPYLTYLRGRGLSDRTVVLYRMGYVDGAGPLGGRVVVPSFDANGSVNFWSARTIHPDVRPTYRLPDASKDVISNEHMVDWSKPVYLVEGIFDEIAVGPQAIALYGKFLQPRLALTLVQKRPPMTYVCLDDDARMEAMVLMRRLVGYDLACSRLDLKGKDPGVVGRRGVDEAAASSLRVTGSAGLAQARGLL